MFHKLLENYRVATQLVARRVVLSSTELFIERARYAPPFLLEWVTVPFKVQHDTFLALSTDLDDDRCLFSFNHI
jgi:hypothetical protein